MLATFMGPRQLNEVICNVVQCFVSEAAPVLLENDYFYLYFIVVICLLCLLSLLYIAV